MNNTNLYQKFRQLVYQSLPKRADATLDLIDALSVAGHVASPAALSEENPEPIMDIVFIPVEFC